MHRHPVDAQLADLAMLDGRPETPSAGIGVLVDSLRRCLHCACRNARLLQHCGGREGIALAGPGFDRRVEVLLVRQTRLERAVAGVGSPGLADDLAESLPV